MANGESYQNRHIFFAAFRWVSLCRQLCNLQFLTLACNSADTAVHMREGVRMPPGPQNGHKPLHWANKEKQLGRRSASVERRPFALQGAYSG